MTTVFPELDSIPELFFTGIFIRYKRYSKIIVIIHQKKVSEPTMIRSVIVWL